MLSDALIRQKEYKESYTMIINNAEKCMQKHKFNRDFKVYSTQSGQYQPCI